MIICKFTQTEQHGVAKWVDHPTDNTGEICLQSLLLWYSLDVQNTKTTSAIFYSSHVMLPYKMVAYTNTQPNYTVFCLMNFMYILFTLIFPSVKLRENSLSKSPHYITPSQFTKKKISQKKKIQTWQKKRFGTEVIKLVNNAYCTFSSRFQWWLLKLLKVKFSCSILCLCSLDGVHIQFKVFIFFSNDQVFMSS